MTPTVHMILIGIALLLTIISLIRPEWRLLQVAVLLVCIDLFVVHSK